QQVIEVLGTHFNVSAYPEKLSTETTLLQGVVKIHAGQQSYLLKPGQQSLVSSSGVKLKNIDIDEAVAWKDGDFIFNRTPIKDMMEDLARWYDLEINYQGYVDRGDTFTGIISREKDITDILQLLEKTNSIQFSLKRKTLYLINK
ncbi:MAG: FecR family protein, partial [Sphingobacterium siyangense]